jgi:hypothetical protein
VLQYAVRAGPVHAGVLQRQGVRVAGPDLHVQVGTCSLAGAAEHRGILIDADDGAGLADRGGQGGKIGSRAAADVEHGLALREVHARSSSCLYRRPTSLAAAPST